MKDFSFVTNSHPAYIESLYQDYRKDPGAVDPEWGKFFEGFDFAVNNVNGKAAGAGAPVSSDQLTKELNVYRLIQAYRKKGHLISKTNPIRERKDRQANLDISFFGLTEADLKTEFYIGQELGLGKTSLENIVSRLKQVYTAAVGLEYAYVNDAKKVEWLQREMETTLQRTLTLEQRKRVLNKLNQGVIFEKFLHTKYIGQKRFGLEGGENTIPALDAIINTAAGEGVQEAVIGMAHRGRLNVLANILGKTYEQIFNEFEGHAVPDLTMGSGDVKYHLGFRSIVDTPGGAKVNLQLLPNPSHLEVVDPLVTGFARSKADVIYNSDYDKILPILIHGDAAVAGQGVIYELIQMSNLKGYYTGGTMHLVINNQIGFTTDFDDARSSDYCTSIAATVQAPVFHVNGDDAEAVVKVAEIAARYRQEFNSDIFIDLLCYRRHGHNEGDEPKFTQPSLYALIDKHPNPREVYTQYLLQNGESEVQDLAKEMEKTFWAQLQERLDEVRQNPLPYTYQTPEQWWQELRKSKPEDFEASPVTAVKEEDVRRLIGRLMTWPKEFVPLRKVEKLLQDKIKLYETEGKVDWATGELLAYASLLSEGKDVRMSGEDVKRGTFSHRHAILFDENTNATYSRLGDLQEKQGQFRIYNSLLSEFAVLGFEYGYAMANPKSLVIWEAQYGDFANGAQTVIDQYITSAEQKWTNQNGMVMLLPHGYEGGGPDHSNARPERFLQSCAEYNIIVTNITTAANFFHALRRQLTWPFRKPLVNFSPKANLRHVGSYSPISAFTEGGFKEVLDDEYVDDASKVKKVLLCTGKIYFELAEKQAKDNRKDVAIVRLEQLYPLPAIQLEALNQKYKAATWFWVQEEPLNMGAASYLQMNLKQINYGVISRNPSAATATGYAKVHAREQLEIIETAFNI
ncbi:2-oxoglutarate dehydrogenase E1 component [Chitinophaga sp.]|uniref:2-oxoglutarate dehydrogenase E1 component n=1 Tax=Chitinophaga sp. TaxID=1869181 RepID=UPI0031DAE5EC